MRTREEASRRSYRLGRRAQGKADTRLRVLNAAHALFTNAGFHAVTLEDIAHHAGVARTTIFKQFASKVGLLRALEEDVSRRAGVDRLLPTLFVDDARQALRNAFEVGSRVWAAEHLMFRKLRALAVMDVDMHRVMADKDRRRRELVEDLLRRLRAQRAIRAGMTRAQQFDVLWLLTSFESFDAVYSAGHTPAKVGALLLQLCEGALVTPEKRRRQ